MRYAEYRARGLPLGSGTMESGCKQIITVRLKQAGMIWSLPGTRPSRFVHAPNGPINAESRSPDNSCLHPEKRACSDARHGG